MSTARATRVLHSGARALALCCALGSVGCSRPGQAGAAPGRAPAGAIDLTSPGGPGWPAPEPEPATPELTDADVERIATRVARERVPVVTADNPSKGLPNAPVTLQIFGDFQCPACAQAEPSFVRIEQRYQARLRVVWRNLPLARHARARPAARAAVAAFRLGGNKAFWQLHDWFYSSQADLSDAGLRSVAAKLGLDPARLEQAANGTQYDASLAADEAAADRGDVQGTPAVFINDYYLIGGRDEAQYALVIERALREAGAVN